MEHLEIPEKNLFTAKELLYLIPVCNPELYVHFLELNRWAVKYMPNFRPYNNKIFAGGSFPKKILEKILGGKIGEYMDNFCMKITEGFWRRKYKHIIQGDVSIRCKKHVSKFHPKGFQEKVLQRYSDEIGAFESRFKVSVSND